MFVSDGDSCGVLKTLLLLAFLDQFSKVQYGFEPSDSRFHTLPPKVGIF